MKSSLLKPIESAINFKDFEALHIIVLDVDNQLLCFDFQTEVE